MCLFLCNNCSRVIFPSFYLSFSGVTVSESKTSVKRRCNYEKDIGEYSVCLAHSRLSEGEVWLDR